MHRPRAAVTPGITRMALFLFLSGTPFPAFPQHLKTVDAAPVQVFQRSYKASAYVTLFSIPIFSRSGVGYGSAVEKLQTRQGLQDVELDFVSGSIPERAHGLNRFGYMQESVEERGRTPVKAQYFGVMTASREESLNDAKAALQAENAGEVPYVAASAEVENNVARSSVRHLVLPAPRESDTSEIVRMVKASFAPGKQAAASQDFDKTASVPTIHTFLYSLRDAILSPANASHREFLYNAKTYRLQTEKHPDGKVGAEMQRLGLTAAGEEVARMSGVIENELTHDRTAFTLWYQHGSRNSLPLRFEFRPKSYLKLVFDAEPSSHAGAVLAASLTESLR